MTLETGPRIGSHSAGVGNEATRAVQRIVEPYSRPFTAVRKVTSMISMSDDVLAIHDRQGNLVTRSHILHDICTHANYTRPSVDSLRSSPTPPRYLPEDYFVE